ncbi:hypothetical protein EDB80DRAFT_710230 [Ilyonectria destructans]|nr:hypothetical protein EDB80DRAFT_710230 [Ilyonectria destructans]
MQQMQHGRDAEKRCVLALTWVAFRLALPLNYRSRKRPKLETNQDKEWAVSGPVPCGCRLDLDARIAVAGSWQTWAFSTKSWQTFIHAANHDPGQSRDRNRGSSPVFPPGGLFKPDERARQRWIPADPK